MKLVLRGKRAWLLLLLGGIGLACGVFFLTRPSLATSISLKDQADIYLFTNQSTYSFKTDTEPLELLEKSSKPIAEFASKHYPGATFDHRYLVFSKGWDANYASYPTGVVSVDFETGQVHTTKTEHYAHSGSGQSPNYFYTVTSYAGEIGLSQFDKNGRELRHKKIPVDFSVPNFFSDQNGYIYIENIHDTDGIFVSNVLKIDESDLSIVEEISLQDGDAYHYRYTNMIVLSDTLYTPLHSIRDNASKAIAGDNRLLVKSVTSSEEHFIPLPESYPVRLFYQGDYLFIEHDSTAIGRVGFSIFNLRTEESEFVSVSEFPNVHLDTGTNALRNFTLDKQGNLLFTMNSDVICFDMESRSVRSIFTLAEGESPIAIWAVKK